MQQNRSLRFLVAYLFLGLTFVTFSGARSRAEDGDGAAGLADTNQAVHVITEREGEATHFYVDNEEFGEITMTFEMRLKNLKGDTSFPYTATFPAQQRTEAFTVAPIKTGASWEYSYTNYYKLGSNCARHDDSCIYMLPYEPGQKFKVTQGYNGKYSHTGSNQYAIDWQMPEGTPVLAARAGIVVRVKDYSDRGGSSMAFDPYNNYVLIRHEDGTLAHYCHLKKGGCVVHPGQEVAAGQLIAHSGNTGFSTGPHLHLCIFKTKNGRERLSIPVHFRTATETATTLVSGRSYRAAPVAIASAKPTATAPVGGTSFGGGQ